MATKRPQGQYRTVPVGAQLPMAYVIDRGTASYVNEEAYRQKAMSRISTNSRRKTTMMPKGPNRGKRFAEGVISRGTAAASHCSAVLVCSACSDIAPSRNNLNGAANKFDRQRAGQCHRRSPVAGNVQGSPTRQGRLAGAARTDPNSAAAEPSGRVEPNHSDGCGRSPEAADLHRYFMVRGCPKHGAADAGPALPRFRWDRQ